LITMGQVKLVGKPCITVTLIELIEAMLGCRNSDASQ